MDITLVTLALGIAVAAVVKYFIGLGRVPKGTTVSCSGCNSGCHPDVPENPSLGLLKNIK